MTQSERNKQLENLLTKTEKERDEALSKLSALMSKLELPVEDQIAALKLGGGDRGSTAEYEERIKELEAEVREKEDQRKAAMDHLTTTAQELGKTKGSLLSLSEKVNYMESQLYSPEGEGLSELDELSSEQMRQVLVSKEVALREQNEKNMRLVGELVEAEEQRNAIAKQAKILEERVTALEIEIQKNSSSSNYTSESAASIETSAEYVSLLEKLTVLEKEMSLNIDKIAQLQASVEEKDISYQATVEQLGKVSTELQRAIQENNEMREKLQN
jgi:uncharacterized coiled-coil protein SlyX